MMNMSTVMSQGGPPGYGSQAGGMMSGGLNQSVMMQQPMMPNPMMSAQFNPMMQQQQQFQNPNGFTNRFQRSEDFAGGSFNKPPLAIAGKAPQATEYYNLPSVPPTSGVASLLHHQTPGSLYQGQAQVEEERQKRLFFREKERERRRLGLSAPDNYGGVKENKFTNYHTAAAGIMPQQQQQPMSLSRNQESPINIPGKLDQMPQFQQIYQQPQPQMQQPQMQMPFEQMQYAPPPMQMGSPPPMMYPPLQYQQPMYPQQQMIQPQMPMYQDPFSVSAGQRAQSLRQMQTYPGPQPLYAPPQLAGVPMMNPIMQPPPNMLMQSQPLYGQQQPITLPNLAQSQALQRGSQEPVRESFFDRFGQDDTDKRMASLVHQEKAKRLREELQQQIDEKNKRKEEEKKRLEMEDLKREALEQGKQPPTTSTANQPIYYPPGAQQPNPFGGGGMPQTMPPNNQQMGQMTSQKPTQNNDFLNNSFSGPPKNQQMGGVGALPTMGNNNSPNRNQIQLDEYKRDLEKQMEEKKQREDELKRKREEEDRKEDERIKRELDSMNRKFRQENGEVIIDPVSRQNTNQQQKEQDSRNQGKRDYDSQGNYGHGGHPRDHRDQYSQQNRNSQNYESQRRHNDDFQHQRSGHFSEYPPEGESNRNGYGNHYRGISKQQSRKIQVHHGPIDFNQEEGVGPDSYPQMYDQFDQEQEQQQQPSAPMNQDHHYQSPRQHHQNYQRQQSYPPPPNQHPQQQQDFNRQSMGSNPIPPPLPPQNLMMPPPPNLPAAMQQINGPMMQEWQRNVQQMANQLKKYADEQKNVIKGYHREIENMKKRKQQIISEMKNDQDAQIKSQINHLSNAIENLTRKINRQEYSPLPGPSQFQYGGYGSQPPPYNRHNEYTQSKQELVQEILHEIKNVLPLQFQPPQYSHSQSPPRSQMPHVNLPVHSSQQFEHQIVDVNKYNPHPAHYGKASEHKRAPSYPPFAPSVRNSHGSFAPTYHNEHPPPPHANMNVNPQNLHAAAPAHHQVNTSHTELPSTTVLMPSKFPELEQHHILEHYHDPQRQSYESHHTYDRPPPSLGQIQEDPVFENDPNSTAEYLKQIKQQAPTIVHHSVEEIPPKAILPTQVMNPSTRTSHQNHPSHIASHQSKHSHHFSAGTYPQRPQSPVEDETVFEPEPVADMHVAVQPKKLIPAKEPSPPREDLQLNRLPSITSLIQNSGQHHHSPREVTNSQNPLMSQRSEQVSPRPQYKDGTPGPIKLRNNQNKNDSKPPVHPGMKMSQNASEKQSASPSHKRPAVLPKGRSEADLLQGAKKPLVAAQLDAKSRGINAHPTPEEQKHFGFKGGKNLSPEMLNDSNASIRPGTSQQNVGRTGVPQPTPISHPARPTTSQLQVNPRSQQKEQPKQPVSPQLKPQSPSRPQSSHKSIQSKSPQMLKSAQQKSMQDVKIGSLLPNSKVPAVQTQERPTTSQQKLVQGGRPTTTQAQRPTTSQNPVGRPTTSQVQGGRPTTSQAPAANGGRPTTSQQKVGAGRGREQVTVDTRSNVILEETEPEHDNDHSTPGTTVLNARDQYSEQKAIEEQRKQAQLLKEQEERFIQQQREAVRLAELEKQRQAQEQRVERERWERDQREREKIEMEKREKAQRELIEREKKEQEMRERAEYERLMKESKDREKQFIEQQKKENDMKLRLMQSEQDFEKISKAMADQALNTALESVERMQQQMDDGDKIVLEQQFSSTQLAISDALDSIRKMNDKVEAKKQAQASRQSLSQHIYQEQQQQVPSFTSNQQQSPFITQQDEYDYHNEYENPQYYDDNNHYEENPREEVEVHSETYGNDQGFVEDSYYPQVQEDSIQPQIPFQDDQFIQNHYGSQQQPPTQPQMMAEHYHPPWAVENRQYYNPPTDHSPPLSGRNETVDHPAVDERARASLDQQTAAANATIPQGGYNVLFQSSTVEVNHSLALTGLNHSDDPQHFAREEDAIELEREIVREIQDQADRMYYPSGEGDTEIEHQYEERKTPKARQQQQQQQVKINIAPPPEDVRSPQYQLIGPANTSSLQALQLQNQQVDSPSEHSRVYNIPPPLQPTRQSQDTKKSVRFGSEQEGADVYTLSPTRIPDEYENLEANRQHIQMLQQDFSRHQLYTELQNYERQIVRDMNEQQTSQITVPSQNPDQVAYPDPTNFLYNKYLVDNKSGPDAYYKGNEEEKLSPRTRFFLFNKQQPQFALQARDSEEDPLKKQVNQAPQQEGQPKAVLSLNQMMQLKQHQATAAAPARLPPPTRIGMGAMPLPQMLATQIRSDSLEAEDQVRASMHFGLREPLPESTDDETKNFKKRMSEINRISQEYEQIQQTAQHIRALHEVRHVEGMTQFYMQNFQETEDVLKDRTDEVRESKLRAKPQINIGEADNEYKQPSFEINPDQEHLYRPPEVRMPPQPRVDDASNAKPKFMRQHDDSQIAITIPHKEKQMINRQMQEEAKRREHGRNPSEPVKHQNRQVNKNETQNSSNGDLLNIADPLSSVGENEGMRNPTHRSGVSMTDVISPAQRHQFPDIPHANSSRPQTGIKLIRQLTQQNANQPPSNPQIKVKPPLPPLPTKALPGGQQHMSRNVDPNSIQQQRPPQPYYTQQENYQNLGNQVQYSTVGPQSNPSYYPAESSSLPPIRQSYDSETSQTSIINIFNTGDEVQRGRNAGNQYDILQSHYISYQPQPTVQTNSGSTGRLMGELFEAEPSHGPRPRVINPASRQNDPFAIRAQIHEKIYETSQMMRIDNDNLLSKVQLQTKSMAFIRPTLFDPVQSLPPIIDLARRSGETPNASERVGDDVGVAAINMEATNDFQRNFRQWDRQRSTGSRGGSRFDASEPMGLAVAAALPRQNSDSYGNMEALKNTMNQRMTLEGVRTVLPPIQGNTVAVNNQASATPPNGQGRNSQRLLEFLREENNTLPQAPQQTVAPARMSSEETKTALENRPSSQHQPSNSHEILLPQHESPRVPPHERSQTASGHHRVHNDGHGEDHYYSSHYEEESKHDGGGDMPSFQMPRIVEHIVETPRHMMMGGSIPTQEGAAPRLNLTNVGRDNNNYEDQSQNNMGIFNNSERRRNNNQQDEESEDY